jgi:hypothetical protein
MSDSAPNLLDMMDAVVRPWQRLAASLHATGTPLHDISVHVTQPVEAISLFITSPQGQMLIGKLLTENQERLDSLLEAASVDSLLVLIRIRDTSAKNPERIAACKEILNRCLPTVKAYDAKRKEGSLHSKDPQDEINRLEKSLTDI